MSQLRLFLYHIYYKLKDISVLSSLRWVTLWKRQWWGCVCNVMAYLLDSLTNKDIFFVSCNQVSLFEIMSIPYPVKWAEREKAQVDREGENLLHSLHIYTLGSAQPMWRSRAIILLELLVCDSQVNRWLQIFVCLDQFWIRQVLGFDSLIANASALW